MSKLKSLGYTAEVAEGEQSAAMSRPDGYDRAEYGMLGIQMKEVV